MGKPTLARPVFAATVSGTANIMTVLYSPLTRKVDLSRNANIVALCVSRGPPT